MVVGCHSCLTLTRGIWGCNVLNRNRCVELPVQGCGIRTWGSCPQTGSSTPTKLGKSRTKVQRQMRPMQDPIGRERELSRQPGKFLQNAEAQICNPKAFNGIQEATLVSPPVPHVSSSPLCLCMLPLYSCLSSSAGLLFMSVQTAHFTKAPY